LVFLEKDLECRVIVGAVMEQVETEKGSKAAMRRMMLLVMVHVRVDSNEASRSINPRKSAVVRIWIAKIDDMTDVPALFRIKSLRNQAMKQSPQKRKSRVNRYEY
jgi:hypothetical protein